MAIIGHVYGFHSTAGFWGGILGFPSIAAGSWIHVWTGHEAPAYVAMFLVNCVFYFFLISGVMFVRRRLSIWQMSRKGLPL